MRNVLVDTGPLVAAFDAKDARHGWAVEELRRCSSRIATVWPVITEASFILSRRQPRSHALLDMLQKRGIDIVVQTRHDFTAMAELTSQYEDLPMDLADAALVRAYHARAYDAVMTTDIRDFSIYRIDGRPLNLITPFS